MESTSYRGITWLGGMAAMTLAYLSVLGTVGTDRAVLLVSLVFAVSVGAFTVACRGPALFAGNLDGPWRNYVVAWGALFALTMTGGMLQFRADPGFWLTAAAVTAAPLILGAANQARAHRGGTGPATGRGQRSVS